MTRDEERDQLGQRLMTHCPVAALSAAGPWAYKPEAEREAWRVLADLILAYQPPTPDMVIDAHQTDLLVKLVMENNRLVKRLGALGGYARHLDGCERVPCSCGLAKLLGPPA